MKKAPFLLTVFVGVGLLLMGFSLKKGEAAGPKILIRAVTSWPLNHVGTKYYKKFIKRVNDRAKGELEIKLLGGPEVIPAFDQLKALSRGAIGMVHTSCQYYAGAVPEGTAWDLLPPNRVIPFLRKSGVWDAYEKAYQKKGMVFLGLVWPGLRFFIMTNKPISKVEDIKGLKLRGLGGSTDVLVGQLGASLVHIPSAEVYEGLQRGVVDGAIRNATSLIQFKEYEVMKYIISPAICSASSGVWIEAKIWNTIPKHLQTMIKEVMLNTERESYDYYTKLDNDMLKEAQEKYGMKVIQLGKDYVSRLNEIKSGAAIKDWITKKNPKTGLPIYEKLQRYLQ